MWEILIHIAYFETYYITNDGVTHKFPNFPSLQTQFNQYILKGYDCPCSYLLKFRSDLLDTNLFYKVCVSVFIYYVYQIVVYILIFY